eukprot:jgi/Psemu1/327441/estExt_fgenesh1_pg.C_6600002
MLYYELLLLLLVSRIPQARSLAPSSGGGGGGDLLGRRDLLGKTTAAVVAGSGLLAPWPATIQDALAAVDADGGVAAAAATNRGPVAVVGATGRTGSLCVDACLRRGIPVLALTRTGEWTAPPTPEGAVTTAATRDDNQKPQQQKQLLTVARCDVVRDPGASLVTNLEGCAAVIYAASASKNGGSATDVDNAGVVRVANACLEAGVGRCVLISSTATTRPKSLGYVFTNLGVGGNIMGEKRNGELGLMEAYRKQQSPLSPSSPSYTIVRPGGLEEPKRNKVLGPAVLEVSQGDVFSGIISRADVAELTVELALSEAPNIKNTAVELYYTDSVVPVENKFKALLKSESASLDGPDSRLRLHGSTYQELLTSVKPGIDFAA